MKQDNTWIYFSRCFMELMQCKFYVSFTVFDFAGIKTYFFSVTDRDFSWIFHIATFSGGVSFLSAIGRYIYSIRVS